MRIPFARTAGLGAGVLALLAAASPAAAYWTNGFESPFNNSMSNNISVCAPGSNGAPLYTHDGAWTGHSLSNAQGPKCPVGQYRVQRIETRVIGGRTMYMNRGGGTYSQRSGHIPRTSLTSPPATDMAWARGNGGSVSCNGATVYSNPHSIVGDFKYKQDWETSSDDNTNADWNNYAAPGGTTDYNYLLWNLPRLGWTPAGAPRAPTLDGGGIPRVAIRRGTPIKICDNPGSLYNEAFDRYNNPVGWTLWTYGFVMNGDWTISHGWFLHAYIRNGWSSWSLQVSGNPV